MGNGIRSGIYRILIAFTFISTSLLGFAQNDPLTTEALPGFVLTKNYDTIYCNIAYQFNEDKTLKNLITTDDDGDEVIVDDVIALFNRANEIYVENNFALGPEFLKVLDDGATKLLGFGNFKNERAAKKSVLNMSSEGLFYYIIEAEGGSYVGNISPKNNATYFIEKGNKMFRLKTLDYREQIMELLYIDSSVVLKNMDYRQIPILIREYNNDMESGDNKYFAYKIINDDEGEVLEEEFGVERVYNDKIRATDEINLLFDNALVVRLKTNKRKIEAYRNAGMDEKADKLEEELKIANQEIIMMFREYYVFCPVYFINAEDYNLALNEQPGIFLNDLGDKDPSITLDYPTFLFCDRGAAYASVLANQGDANTKMVSSTPTVQDAFVIKNRDLEQLVEPFPYKVSIRFDNIEGSVKKLNYNMMNFYGK